MTAVIRTLITHGLLCQDTMVTAKISSQSGAKSRMIDLSISEIEADDEDFVLILDDPISRKSHRICAEHIVSIEGMAVDRYAEVYNINADGTQREIGKKRGRKPKIRI